MSTFSTTPPPDDQLTLLVWFIVRFKPDATVRDEALRRGTIFPVPGSYLGGYMSKPGWEWMRLDEFWKQPPELSSEPLQVAEIATLKGKMGGARAVLANIRTSLLSIEEALK